MESSRCCGKIRVELQRKLQQIQPASMIDYQIFQHSFLDLCSSTLLKL